MDINEAAHLGAAEQRAADHTVARRRLLAAGATGTALSLLPFLAGRAGAAPASSGGTDDSTGNSTANTPAAPGASTADSTAGSTSDTTASSDGTPGGATGSTADTAAATTTTAPPKRPTDADIGLLSFAQMLELAARDLYNVALGKSVFADATLEAVKAIGEAHEAYAQAISGLIGRVAPNSAQSDLFDELSKDFEGSAKDVATAARSLENNLVATHVDIVGKLVGVDGSALVASMVVVEARHATVLAHIAGVDTLDDQLATEGEAIPASAVPAT